MKIDINPCISTRAYKTDSALSFILNENRRIYYLLKGKISKLWGAVTELKDYEKILIYAKENGLADELLPFLAELKQKGIIEADILPANSEDKYLTYVVSMDDKENFYFFTNLLNGFFIKNNLLSKLSLQLSYKCNLVCKHCFNPKDMDKYEISFETAKNIIDEAYRLGITTVGFTGGECTIHKDFLKIAEYARKKYLSLTILTNAQRLYDDDFFRKFVSFFYGQVQISLYSMNSDVHDYITGVKGSHKKTLRVIKKLVENNVKTVINSVQLKFNKNDYTEVRKFADSIGVLFKTSSYFLDNKENHNSYVQISNKEIEEFYLDNLKNGAEKRLEFKKDKGMICNNGGTLLLNVSPKLDITPCNDFNYSFGNYKDISITEVWNNIIPKFRREFIRENLKECFKYEYCRYCGYCPKAVMFDTGFMKKSPAACTHAKAYYNALLHLQSSKNDSVQAD